MAPPPPPAGAGAGAGTPNLLPPSPSSLLMKRPRRCSSSSSDDEDENEDGENEHENSASSIHSGSQLSDHDDGDSDSSLPSSAGAHHRRRPRHSSSSSDSDLSGRDAPDSPRRTAYSDRFTVRFRPELVPTNPDEEEQVDLPPPERVDACAPARGGEPFSEACSCAGRASWAWFPVNAPSAAMQLTPAPCFDLNNTFGNTLEHMPALEKLPPGVRMVVVSDLPTLDSELELLTASLVEGPHADGVVGLDFEWAPRFHFRGPDYDQDRERPISLIQLASQTRVLLVRLCCLHCEERRDGTLVPPKCLSSFFADPRLHFVGFSVHANDATKVFETFGVMPGALIPPRGGENSAACTDDEVEVPPSTPRLFDACAVAGAMGYPAASLARLSACLFGRSPPKSGYISTSNWEASSLNMRQRQYAAVDAWIVGEALRGLRWWHARQRNVLRQPSERMHSAASLEDFQRALASEDTGASEEDYRTHCATCAVAFGTVFPDAPLECPVEKCAKKFKDSSQKLVVVAASQDATAPAAPSDQSKVEHCDSVTWAGALRRLRFYDHLCTKSGECGEHAKLFESVVCGSCGRFEWTPAS
ncbi:hypothetical protein PPROV_000414100 [Pycnococcus provasolii]|uniref:3'-5' exonuclease domain-containing protein n=3 Tax=Pycnococcus provasolii TaxID=41880 RepID=A0A830HHY4_9CHLO|nr:hypothetical protein PPROV_000414100 [Pycnococcus provasolii]